MAKNNHKTKFSGLDLITTEGSWVCCPFPQATQLFLRCLTGALSAKPMTPSLLHQPQVSKEASFPASPASDGTHLLAVTAQLLSLPLLSHGHPPSVWLCLCPNSLSLFSFSIAIYLLICQSTVDLQYDISFKCIACWFIYIHILLKFFTLVIIKYCIYSYILITEYILI